MVEEQVQRVLAAAHPDDVTSDLVARSRPGRTRVSTCPYCNVTNGDAAGSDPEVPRSGIGSIRQEQRKAAPRWAAPTSSSSATRRQAGGEP